MTQHPSDPDVPDGMPEHNHPDNTADAFDELALRRLMRDAVRDLEPGPEALDRLRHAIPARRTRRRQAMVGAAAGVLLVGTAVPAVLHAATTGGTDTVGAANASSHTAVSSPGALGGPGTGGGTSDPAGTVTGGGAGGGSTARPSPLPSASRSGSRGSTAPTGGLMTVASPTCARGQLGRGSAQTGAPDQEGRVYGSFRVVNVSNTSCTVSGEGQISVTAQGSTDPSRIQVVDHTAGDPASGLLPDPATAPDSVTLPPGKAYQVDFAWIPAAGGGASGCAAPSTGGSTTGGGSAGTTSSGNTGPSTTDAGTSGNTPATGNAQAPADSSSGGGTPTSPPAAGGITLSNIPDSGPPSTASTTINGACAGTVYRTPALPAS
ncbi:hypothetical protein ACFOSC_28700 [Streptantibioticus rubrisoli]|uniref:DUF4232 domain-containing protein n=1 Tax=Streptantibioticus rubrisoli TaxID=1387313 RepID=A0ABT1PJT1_9ACTN|nr:hypothetical protein [Streptantibioticus rubrisoli]MCQ4045614.1 hypothetical protein [Streptantibioticus rubrisoli]